MDEINRTDQGKDAVTEQFTRPMTPWATVNKRRAKNRVARVSRRINRKRGNR